MLTIPFTPDTVSVCLVSHDSTTVSRNKIQHSFECGTLLTTAAGGKCAAEYLYSLYTVLYSTCWLAVVLVDNVDKGQSLRFVVLCSSLLRHEEKKLIGFLRQSFDLCAVSLFVLLRSIVMQDGVLS